MTQFTKTYTITSIINILTFFSGISHTVSSLQEMETNNSVNASSSNCLHLLSDPDFSHAPERFTMNLITAIINIITAPVAVVTNVLVVIAIFSCSRLRTPSNLLIGCLAVSDVLVGLTVQPGYITYRLMENQFRSVPCFVRITYASAFYLCFGVSFMTLSAVSYERFVAVRLRIRYNAIFSSRRVVNYMLVIWLLNILLSALQWAKISQVAVSTHLALWLICLIFSVATQIRAVLIIFRRNRRQVQVHLQDANNVQRQIRETKLARSISIIVGVYLILNFPVLFVEFYNIILKLDLKTNNHYSWSETLAFLNSCSNPFICCWKNRQICQKVRALLKKVFCWISDSGEDN